MFHDLYLAVKKCTYACIGHLIEAVNLSTHNICLVKGKNGNLHFQIGLARESKFNLCCKMLHF